MNKIQNEENSVDIVILKEYLDIYKVDVISAISILKVSKS